MNSALSVLCIALGIVGIFSIIFSLFADKRRKEKLKKMKDVIQRKVNTIVKKKKYRNLVCHTFKVLRQAKFES